MGKKIAAAALVLAALTPSAYLAWRWRELPHLGIYHDDAIYFVTAKSLAAGEGYRIESFPGRPWQTKYPPLFPLLLSAVWRAAPSFPENLRLAALVCWLMLPLLVAASWLWFGALGLGARRRAVLCAWLALNPVVAGFSLMVMSELLFAALLAATVWMLERAGRQRDSALWAAASGALAGAAYLARSAALPLLATAPACFVWRRQWRKAAAFFCGMTPAILAWELWKLGHLMPGNDTVTLYYTSYLGYYLANVSLSNLWLVLQVNCSELVTGLGDVLMFFDAHNFASLTLARITLAAAVAGVVRLVRRTGALQFPVFAAAYIPILLLWHYPPNARFVMPLAPLLLAGFSEEIGRLWRLIRPAWSRQWTRKRAGAAAMTMAAASICGVAAHRTVWGLTVFLPRVFSVHQEALEQSQPAYRWIAGRLPAEASLLAYDDPVVYLYTGRQAASVRIPPRLLYAADRAGIERFLERVPGYTEHFGLEFAVLTDRDFRLETQNPARESLRRRIEAAPGAKLRYEGGGISIYEFAGASLVR